MKQTQLYVVEREMYTFDAASVGASCASTSHEQGDSEWGINTSEEEDDEDD